MRSSQKYDLQPYISFNYRFIWCDIVFYTILFPHVHTEYIPIWWFPYMGGYPQSSSILMGFFPSKNHPFWGTPIYGTPHIFIPQTFIAMISLSQVSTGPWLGTWRLSPSTARVVSTWKKMGKHCGFHGIWWVKWDLMVI